MSDKRLLHELKSINIGLAILMVILPISIMAAALHVGAVVADSITRVEKIYTQYILIQEEQHKQHNDPILMEVYKI